MDRKKHLKSVILLYATLGIPITAFSLEHKPNQYAIYEETEGPFGAYQNGNVYIGNHKYINSIKDEIKPGDVLIERGYKTSDGDFDPNYKIYSSYLITDINDQEAILNILSAYNSLNPWGFERTIESMKIEWCVHNILYDVGIERDRTKDVDLNNSDEEKYSLESIKRLIK